MSEKRSIVFEALEALGVPYEVWEHPAVYTIEEMDALHLPDPSVVVKNLFLRDAKGKQHFLVVLQKDKQADLRALGEHLGVKLSFASEERLMKYLGLEKGAVTPFGILNDTERAVEVLLDADLECMPRIGVHPNENSATVVLKPADLVRIIERHGNPVEYMKV